MDRNVRDVNDTACLQTRSNVLQNKPPAGRNIDAEVLRSRAINGSSCFFFFLDRTRDLERIIGGRVRKPTSKAISRRGLDPPCHNVWRLQEIDTAMLAILALDFRRSPCRQTWSRAHVQLLTWLLLPFPVPESVLNKNRYFLAFFCPDRTISLTQEVLLWHEQ